MIFFRINPMIRIRSVWEQFSYNSETVRIRKHIILGNTQVTTHEGSPNNRQYSFHLKLIFRHAPLEHDIELQIARIACITSGFNMIDDQKYKSCKTRFKIMDKIYKTELKRLKKLSKKPELSATMEGYQESRAKYLKLRNQFLEQKFLWKIFFSVAKLLKKFILPV